MFGVCFSPCFRHISPPNEPADQLLPGALRASRRLMVLVILMQRPKSEGLGAAFGAGVTENIFGAQTTNVLVKFTTWLAGIFFALTFALSVLYSHHSVASSAFRRELMKNQPAQTSPAPAKAQSSPGSSPATTPAQASPAVSPAASAAPTGSPKS